MGLTYDQEDFCHKLIHSCALLSGGANLLPLPGLGIGADLGAMISLGIHLNTFFKEEIEDAVKNSLSRVERMSIAKTNLNLETAKFITPKIVARIMPQIITEISGVNLAENVIKNLAIQAIKETAGKSVAKEFVKFLPIIGQIAAPTMSIAIIETTGWSLANKLHNKIYKEATSRLDEIVQENEVPDYIKDKIIEEINSEYNG